MMLRIGRPLVAMTALGLLSATAAHVGDNPGLENLSGRWKMDWDRSEPVEPVMKALELPWLVRQLAGVVSLHMSFSIQPPECDVCEDRLQIMSENPIKNTTRIVVLDGVARPAVDPLGNKSLEKYRWGPDGRLEMTRTRVLKSGKKALLREQRKVGDYLDTLVSTMTVWIEDKEVASVRRIMIRDPK